MVTNRQGIFANDNALSRRKTLRITREYGKQTFASSEKKTLKNPTKTKKKKSRSSSRTQRLTRNRKRV